MKLVLMILAAAVAAAGSLLVAGHAVPARQSEQIVRILLTPDTGLMPEVTAYAPRPEMMVDEVVVTAPRPESLPEEVCETGGCVAGPLAN